VNLQRCKQRAEGQHDQRASTKCSTAHLWIRKSGE
jgi:hypothetical protein